MSKNCSYVFLPHAIYSCGGIEGFINSHMTPYKYGDRYPQFWNMAFGTKVLSWIAIRLARSGRVDVSKANHILWLAAKRYSGTPERTFNANCFKGMGKAICSEYLYGCTFEYIDANSQCLDAELEARKQYRQYTSLEKRTLWPNCEWDEAAKEADYFRRDYLPIQDCFACYKRAKRHEYIWANDSKLMGIQQGKMWFCFACWMKFCKLKKAAYAADDARRLAGRIRRKLNESAKDTARID